MQGITQACVPDSAGMLRGLLVQAIDVCAAWVGRDRTAVGMVGHSLWVSACQRTSVFTQAELAYLRGERRLAHLATVGSDGTPHVTPVGMWSLGPEEVVEVTGHDFAATKKFRDVARSGSAAIVIDDVLPPFRPRGVEIRGPADALHDPRPHIRIHPRRIIGWGLDDTERGRNARDVPEKGGPR